MSHPVPIFIGYDPREAVAYHVCQQSIIDHCADPSRLMFRPLTGQRRDGSNDFVYSRFLVPWLCGFAGLAVFIDGDMIVRADVLDLLSLHQPRVGCQVVKHDYRTKHPTKYLGNKNEDYPRKNWSSVILWDCSFHPNRVLTPTYVAQQSGAFLHRFGWLADDQIGSLPSGWNRLVMEQPISSGDSLLHYTIGIPAFAEYAACDGAEEWWESYRRALLPIKGSNVA